MAATSFASRAASARARDRRARGTRTGSRCRNALVGEDLRLDAEGASDCARPVAHPELLVRVVEVFADRSRREIENGGDLAVRLPSRNPEKNLALAGSERGKRPRPTSTRGRVAP